MGAVRAPMDAFVRVGPLIGPKDSECSEERCLRCLENSQAEPEPEPNCGLCSTGIGIWSTVSGSETG